MLNHVFGVDIDHQAVEMTKLSLLLKVLEGESEETLATQLSFFQERALPNQPAPYRRSAILACRYRVELQSQNAASC